MGNAAAAWKYHADRYLRECVQDPITGAEVRGPEPGCRNMENNLKLWAHLNAVADGAKNTAGDLCSEETKELRGVWDAVRREPVRP